MAGRSVTSLCVMVAVASQMVTGRPHQCFLDEYTKAVLAQLYPSDAAAVDAATKLVPLAYDNGESLALRPGRSNDKSVPAPGPPHVVLLPPSQNSSGTGNYTAIEKLTAYYERLKDEQESLARHQLQQQLYEQQQRRQQEFAAIQQQLHLQYYQQQQNAMIMLENLRNNPEFVKQVAAFAGRNGTVPPALPAADRVTATVRNESTMSPEAVAGRKRLPDVKEQSIVDHDKDDKFVDDDNDDDSGWGAKRLDARQADDVDEDDDDGPVKDGGDRPVLEKVYSMATE